MMLYVVSTSRVHPLPTKTQHLPTWHMQIPASQPARPIGWSGEAARVQYVFIAARSDDPRSIAGAMSVADAAAAAAATPAGPGHHIRGDGGNAPALALLFAVATGTATFVLLHNHLQGILLWQRGGTLAGALYACVGLGGRSRSGVF